MKSKVPVVANKKVEEQPAPKRKWNWRSEMLVLLAKLGMKRIYLVLAEVKDTKGRVSRAQFFFQCRPWLLTEHVPFVNQEAIKDRMAAGSLKPEEVHSVLILNIVRVGFVK